MIVERLINSKRKGWGLIFAYTYYIYIQIYRPFDKLSAQS